MSHHLYLQTYKHIQKIYYGQPYFVLSFLFLLHFIVLFCIISIYSYFLRPYSRDNHDFSIPQGNTVLPFAGFYIEGKRMAKPISTARNHPFCLKRCHKMSLQWKYQQQFCDITTKNLLAENSNITSAFSISSSHNDYLL